jgi:hypothetical protein
VYNASGRYVRQVHKSDEADVHPPAEPAELRGDERWELVIRIAQSPSFRKSPRLRQFLVFVAELSLTGRAGEISEYEIGWKVFERPQHYNPSEDSIVRTAARQLRTKVKEYFDSEGSSETWHLEIPKGGYVPIFTKRDAAAPMPTAPPEPAPAASTRPSRQIPWRAIGIIMAALAIASILTTGVLWRVLQQRSQPTPSIVSTVFADGQDATHLVVGDFGLALMSLATKQVFSVEQYASRSYPPVAPEAKEPAPLANIWNLFSSGQIVSYPDVAVAGAIIRVGGMARKKIIVQNAREITARDLRSGNYILLSAPIASPWMSLFQDKLNFQYQLSYRSDSVSPISAFYNRHPLPGEKALYEAAATTPGFGVTYGLIARVPNLTGTGKVLLIFGLKYTGLEVAGEYATDPRRAAELARMLRVADIQHAPDFEVVVETYSLDAAPRYIKAVAVRAISAAR